MNIIMNILLAGCLASGLAIGWVSCSVLNRVDWLKEQVKTYKEATASCMKDNDRVRQQLNFGSTLNKTLSEEYTKLADTLDNIVNSTEEAGPNEQTPKTPNSPTTCVSASGMRDIERLRK